MMVYFKVVDGMDQEWFALIGDDIGVLSTRETGNWQPDSLFGAQDLILPEQKFSEWDVIEVSASEVPPLPRQ